MNILSYFQLQVRLLHREERNKHTVTETGYAPITETEDFDPPFNPLSFVAIKRRRRLNHTHHNGQEENKEKLKDEFKDEE